MSDILGDAGGKAEGKDNFLFKRPRHAKLKATYVLFQNGKRSKAKIYSNREALIKVKLLKVKVDICQLVWLTKNTSYENVGGIFLRKNTIDS